MPALRLVAPVTVKLPATERSCPEGEVEVVLSVSEAIV
jgi:hypothetical protein